MERENQQVTLNRDEWIDIIAVLDVARSKYEDDDPFRLNLEKLLMDITVQTAISDLVVLKPGTIN